MYKITEHSNENHYNFQFINTYSFSVFVLIQQKQEFLWGRKQYVTGIKRRSKKIYQLFPDALRIQSIYAGNAAEQLMIKNICANRFHWRSIEQLDYSFIRIICTSFSLYLLLIVPMCLSVRVTSLNIELNII